VGALASNSDRAGSSPLAAEDRAFGRAVLFVRPVGGIPKKSFSDAGQWHFAV
jgi:hypothetical protein